MSAQEIAPKKRNRDPLGPRVAEERNKKLKIGYIRGNVNEPHYLYKKGLKVWSKKEIVAQHKRNQANRSKSKTNRVKPAMLPFANGGVLAVHGVPAAGQNAARRSCIAYCFNVMHGAPEKDQWVKHGVTKDIMERLQIPKGSWKSVEAVFLDCLKNPDYDPRGNQRRRSPNQFILSANSDEATHLFDALDQQLSYGQATVLLNEYRDKLGLHSISMSTVKKFAKTSSSYVIGKRATKKCSQMNADTEWCKARLAQSVQLRNQLELG